MAVAILISQLLELYGSSFDKIVNKPEKLNESLPVFVYEKDTSSGKVIKVSGYSAVFLVDDHVQVIPKTLGDISIPEQEFSFEIDVGGRVKFNKFCGRECK